MVVLRGDDERGGRERVIEEGRRVTSRLQLFLNSFPSGCHKNCNIQKLNESIQLLLSVYLFTIIGLQYYFLSRYTHGLAHTLAAPTWRARYRTQRLSV